MNELLAMIVALLVFPGLLFALVAALIFGWIRSYAHASAQGWTGTLPRLSLREVTRRLRQGSTVSEGAFAPLIQALPILAAICPLLVLVFLPIPANRAADNNTFTADVVAVAALLLGLPLLRTLLGWATPSPYTQMAATRSARQLLGHVIPYALAVAVGVAIATSLQLYFVAHHQFTFTSTTKLLGLNGTQLMGVARMLAGLAYFACLPILARITPIREGQGGMDLVGNELTELSGRELLVMRIAEWMQLIAALGFGIVLFVLPFFSGDGARAIATVVAALVGSIALGVWDGSGAYLRAAREDLVAPLSIWFGTQTFLGIIALLVLVLAERYTV
jgi:NADH:ubiquinone oxidoreductase subunit H